MSSHMDRFMCIGFEEVFNKFMHDHQASGIANSLGASGLIPLPTCGNNHTFLASSLPLGKYVRVLIRIFEESSRKVNEVAT